MVFLVQVGLSSRISLSVIICLLISLVAVAGMNKPLIVGVTLG